MGVVIYKPTAERSSSHTSGKNRFVRGELDHLHLIVVIFKPKHDVFLTPTKWLLCRHLSRA